MYTTERYEQLVEAYYTGYNPASVGKFPKNIYLDVELQKEFERGIHDGMDEAEAWETYKEAAAF